MATINAASASQAAVEAAIAAASAGDTVAVPAGSATWAGLAIAKAIHLQGAGVGVTNITLGNNNSVTKQAAGVTRVSGFSFSRSGDVNKAINIYGEWKTAKPIIFNGNRFDNDTCAVFRVEVVGGFIFADNDVYGDWDSSFLQLKKPGSTTESWLADHTMGTADTNGEWNIYVEGNYFYGNTNQGIDADDGARLVFRYNICDYFTVNSHGLDTSATGLRHFEVYSNTFRNDAAGGHTGGTTINDISNQNWVVWVRGGTGVIYNNTLENIANSYWGYGKTELLLDIRAVQDNTGASYGHFTDGRAKYSSGQGTYPRQHQIGQNWSLALSNSVGINGGVGDYFTDPVYVWGNTGSGANAQGGFLAAGGGSWEGASQASYLVEGRDYYNDGTQRPDYTAYTYPHPLLAGDTGGVILPAPAWFRAQMGA